MLANVVVDVNADAHVDADVGVIVVVGINTPWHELKLESIYIIYVLCVLVVFIHSLNKIYIDIFISILLTQSSILLIIASICIELLSIIIITK